MQEIEKFQKKTIQICKDFLHKEKNKNIDVSLSPLCFFTIWGKTPGLYKVFELLNMNIGLKFTYVVRNIFSISKDFDLELFFNRVELNTKAKNLIISYSSKENFDKNGNFFDNYFNFSTKNKDYFWLLISLDNYIPKKLKSNLAIIAKKKNGSFSILYLLKRLYKLLSKNYFELNKIRHYCWKEYNFARRVSDLSKFILEKLELKGVIFNYEGVPFQNNLLLDVKKINRNIKTLCYLHCAPWPIQTDLIYKDQPVDKLVVSGIHQKKNLIKYLGWNAKKIKVIPSLRFKKKKKKEFNGYLFVPFNLDNEENYLKMLEEYLIKMKDKFYLNYLIRIHPLNSNSKKHLKFKEKSKNLISKYLQNKHKKKTMNNSLFFGSATGVCIQSLEEGTDIIHFPKNKYLDVFSDKMWPSLNIKQIGGNIFEYKLKRKNLTFFVNKNRDNFTKYFVPLIKK